MELNTEYLWIRKNRMMANSTYIFILKVSNGDRWAESNTTIWTTFSSYHTLATIMPMNWDNRIVPGVDNVINAKVVTFTGSVS